MPTPVSSLLHAATLVLAGIYVIIRSNSIFMYCNIIYIYIGIIGSLTCICGSIVGIYQIDLKRIIAFSTISQMGYLYIACSIGIYNVCIFHIMNHAFFKSMLFICSGIIIHSIYDMQDIRLFGGYRFILPIQYIVIIICSISLIAIPSTSGYYSKDMILEIIGYNNYIYYNIFYYIGIISAINTSIYSIKILILVFIYKPNNKYNNYIYIHSVNYILYIPIIILCCFSIVIGYIFSDIYIGIGNSIFNTISYNIDYINIYDYEYNYSIYTKFIPFMGTIIGISIGIYIYIISNIRINTNIYYINIINFIYNNIYLDYIYNKYILYIGFNICFYIYKYIDTGIISYIGPIGIKNSILDINSINNIYTNIYSFNIFIIYVISNIFIFFIFSIISIMFIPFNMVIYTIFIIYIIYINELYIILY